MQTTTVQSVFINLPIQNVARTRDFWTKLGFTINEAFSDEKTLCLVLKPDNIYAMLMTRERLQTFTHKPVADGTTTQVLLAVDVGSRAKVDEVMRIAVENGATCYLQPEDAGWMYYDRFVDLDGHQWEISTMDASVLPKEGAQP